MKSNKVYGLIGTIAAMAICATALAQDGGRPRDNQGGPPPGMGQGQGRMGGGPGMRRGPGMEPLVLRPDVAKELKLSDEQKKKLKSLFPMPGGQGGMRGGPNGQGGPGGGRGGDDQPRGRGGNNDDDQGGPPPRDRRGNDDDEQGGPGGPPPQARRGGDDEGPGGNEQGGGRRGQQGGMRRMDPGAMEDKLNDILSDSQMKRLKELRLQREGAFALLRPEIGEKVGLSDKDRDRIHDLVDDAMESMRPDGDQMPDRKAMEAKHAKVSEKILKSLSSKQRAKWDDLAGKPFKFDENWHPEGRRGGDDRQGGPRGHGNDRGPGERGGRDDDRGGPPPRDGGDGDGDGGGSIEQGIIDATMHHG